MVLSLFLPRQWQVSFLFPVMFTPISCRITQKVDSSWSCSTGEDMPTATVHSRREYCVFFSALSIYWTHLLYQGIIQLLNNTDFWLSLFKVAIYFFDFFGQFFIVSWLIVNKLCFIQRLQCFHGLNSGHDVNKNVTDLKNIK